MWRAILTYIIATIIVLPTIAMFNENDDIMVNLGGLSYFIILVIIGHTKIGQKGLKQLRKAYYKLTKIIG